METMTINGELYIREDVAKRRCEHLEQLLLKIARKATEAVNGKPDEQQAQAVDAPETKKLTDTQIKIRDEIAWRESLEQPWTIPQVAETVGCGQGTVWSYIHYVRREGDFRFLKKAFRKKDARIYASQPEALMLLP